MGLRFLLFPSLISSYTWPSENATFDASAYLIPSTEPGCSDSFARSLARASTDDTSITSDSTWRGHVPRPSISYADMQQNCVVGQMINLIRMGKLHAS